MNQPTSFNTRIEEGPMRQHEVECIRDVANSMAHRQQKKESGWWHGGSYTTSSVYDAAYRDWSLLAILSDIALSLRTLAAPAPTGGGQEHSEVMRSIGHSGE